MVKCKVCGQEMKWIQNSHLKKHNLSLTEYKELYPGAETIDKETKIVIAKTRIKRVRIPIKLCKREGCNNPVADYRYNVYCSYRCNGLDNPEVGLQFKGYAEFGKKNHMYVDGKYSRCKHQKEKAYERDIHVCQKCGKKVDGKKSKYGIHHILPRRLFKSDEEANSLDNLMTLCSVCHAEAEKLVPEILFELYVKKDIRSTKNLMAYIKEKILSK